MFTTTAVMTNLAVYLSRQRSNSESDDKGGEK